MAQLTVPPSFTELTAVQNATEGTFVDVIGIVVDLMAVTTTSRNEYMVTAKLLDPKLRDAIDGNEGFTVRFFSSIASGLPQLGGIGDILLARRMRVMTYSGQKLAISNKSETRCLVFANGSIPDPNFSLTYMGKNRLPSIGSEAEKLRLSQHEQQYVILLRKEMESHAPIAEVSKRGPEYPSSTMPADPGLGPNKQSSSGNKFKLIKHLRSQQFVDLCVQVVKKYPSGTGKCELYVTDYTENKAMFYRTPPEEETAREQDGDQFGYSGSQKQPWPGPFGYLILKVNLREPHTTYAVALVNEGKFVKLKNVKMKAMNEHSVLEGDMWPDDLHKKKVGIHKLTLNKSPELDDLLERKDRYWQARVQAQKLRDARMNDQALQSKADRNKVKRERKKVKKVKNKSIEDGATETGAPGNGKEVSSIHSTNTGSSNKAEARSHDKTDSAGRDARMEKNKYIRCTNSGVPVTSVADILDSNNLIRHTKEDAQGRAYILPFVNVKYRVLVRVVDYWPRALEMFARPRPQRIDDSHDSSHFADSQASQDYVWHFRLQLEDASPDHSGGPRERIEVSVQHSYAQFLFGKDMDDPADLSKNPGLLAKLREKMCILWGNLEEKGPDDPLSNKPFECCIFEYGAEMNDLDPRKKDTPMGMAKIFMLFETTIK